jgi:hypothetical protein
MKFKGGDRFLRYFWPFQSLRFENLNTECGGKWIFGLNSNIFVDKKIKAKEVLKIKKFEVYFVNKKLE